MTPVGPWARASSISWIARPASTSMSTTRRWGDHSSIAAFPSATRPTTRRAYGPCCRVSPTVFARAVSPTTKSTRISRSARRAAGASVEALGISRLCRPAFVDSNAEVVTERKRPSGALAPTRLRLVVTAEKDQQSGVGPEGRSDQDQTDGQARGWGLYRVVAVRWRRDADVDTGLGHRETER